MKPLEFRFAFHARDFDKSVDFYQNILGLTYVDGWDRQDGKGALLSAGGTAVIEIYGAAEGASYEGPRPTAMNLALRLSNALEVDELYRQLTRGTLLKERIEHPRDHHWGHRSFVVYDPDGIPIHIYCEL